MIDVTIFFWDLVNIINTKTYTEIQETELFKQFIKYVEEEETFKIVINNNILYYDSISDLFYGVDFLIHNEYLYNAIKKMESFIEMDDISNLFECHLNLK
jgi:hypothetical protein